METQVDPSDWSSALAETDGPQLVVAGPGTGKTEFLIRRAIHIAETEKARLDEIALLTFSRRAAADVKKRITKETGRSATPVASSTFHSLALRLLETREGPGRPVPLTTPEQVGLVADLLATEDPRAWPLPYRSILGSAPFAAEVADFLIRCSERLLTPSDLAERAKTRADWRGLPGLYSRYLATLQERSRADYGTLLLSAVELLGEDAGYGLAERFRYVLVDEYQDTTPAQAEMARLLARPHGNLTVAGDPYQSIYSFRGAELTNVARFLEEHPGARRLVLTKSLRVPKAILDAALRVVSPGGLPGGAGPVTPADHSGRVEAYIFDQETAEAEWIAREVQQAHHVQKIPYSEMAVLVRSKRHLLPELSRALSRRSVPHNPPEARLVDHPAVRVIADLVTLATHDRAVSPPGMLAEADRAARRLLLGQLLDVGLGRERELSRRRRRSGEPWSALLADVAEADGFSEVLEDPRWATDIPAADGFWRVWSTVSAFAAVVDDTDGRAWRRAWASLAQVLDRQADRDPGLSLGRFFELTEDEDYEAKPLIGPEAAATDQLTLTTLHQAKGLEFEVVFIADASEGVFPDPTRSRSMLRPELLSVGRTVDPAAQHLFAIQEEMRLAYTAMTRARYRVVWTATDAGIDQGEHRPSRFLLAAAGVDSATHLGRPAETELPPVTIGETEIQLRRLLLDPGADRVRRLGAAHALARGGRNPWSPLHFPGVTHPGPDHPILTTPFRMSPSQADGYSTCPRRYALERRLGLGDPASVYAHFGSLIHDTLERAELPIVGTGEPHATKEEALTHLHAVWESEADFGSPELNRAWLEKAEELISKLYDNWPSPGSTPVGLEVDVEMDVAGVAWKGRVDRLEKTGAGLTIVDYKTSRAPVTKEEAARSVQLGFYAMAVAGDARFQGPVIGAQFWYPRTDSKSVGVRALDKGLLPDVEQEMVRITQSIAAEDWDPVVGDGCRHCAFLDSCPAWPEGRDAFLP